MVIPQTFDLGVTCRSFPALAARIRTLQSAEANSATPPLHIERLVQAYTILSYPQVEDEAKATVHVVQHILERLRRLASAYYEWQTFEPAAYFDLTNAQCALLLNIAARRPARRQRAHRGAAAAVVSEHSRLLQTQLFSRLSATSQQCRDG